MNSPEALRAAVLFGDGNGGGGGGIIAGAYTPTENTDSAIFDIGSSFNYFVLFADSEPGGKGARAFRAAVFDFSRAANGLIAISTNNQGTGVQGLAYYEASNYLSREGNTVRFTGLNNYLIADVTYKWLAW